MIIYPAIDILGKEAVRLRKGDYDQVTKYGTPRVVAEKWLAQGSKHLHIVDLNGAVKSSVNKEVVESMVGLDAFIQVGGGIRTYEQAKRLIEMGVNQIIIGTAAVKDPKLLNQLIEDFSDHLTIGIDAINGQVALEGWLDISSIKSDCFIEALEESGVKRIIYTDISRDGMLSGPNFEMYEKLINKTNLEIIASGGVSSLEDIKRLRLIGVDGVVVGKALYENKFSLKEALEC